MTNAKSVINAILYGYCKRDLQPIILDLHDDQAVASKYRARRCVKGMERQSAGTGRGRNYAEKLC